MAEKFVRFVTHRTDEVTGQRLGFFTAVYDLRDSGELPETDHRKLATLLDWFRNSLEAPGRVHRSSNPHAHGKGLSWFKPEAMEHIGRARQILEILERYGVSSETLTTLRPGYVLYEDEYQICAIPFADGS